MTCPGRTIAPVIGAILRDARRQARIPLPDAAHRLGAPVEDIECGHRPVTGGELRRLCDLYGVPEQARALHQLADGPPEGAPGGESAPYRSDRAGGFADRLAAVARQSVRTRWLSTQLVPPPLCIPAYAAAVRHPAPARPWPGLRRQDVVVLDESVVRHGGATAALMCEQVRHLLTLQSAGARIHVVPRLFPPGSYAELALPNATVVAGWGFTDARYQTTTALGVYIERALADPDRDRSRRLLTEAYAHHRFHREAR
ncbi:Scr1 family TA system antitoxin-like transcriptional regulator [Streptomyces californicus]|uniref:Scr1 family TA system antitoxin-like transcriptional regulator n=1 Tax=Streptomyces californicus TaxID=67351 RepID=UPI0034086D3C